MLSVCQITASQWKIWYLYMKSIGTLSSHAQLIPWHGWEGNRAVTLAMVTRGPFHYLGLTKMIGAWICNHINVNWMCINGKIFILPPFFQTGPHFPKVFGSQDPHLLILEFVQHSFRTPILKKGPHFPKTVGSQDPTFEIHMTNPVKQQDVITDPCHTFRAGLTKHFLAVITPRYFNSLWPSDAIWRSRSVSTLAQVMACCLTAPSHYLNQCWLIISEVQWHSYQGNFTRDASTVSH